MEGRDMNGMMNLDSWGNMTMREVRIVYPTIQPSVSYRKEMMIACLKI